MTCPRDDDDYPEEVAATVGELIALLQRFDPSLPIRTTFEGCDHALHLDQILGAKTADRTVLAIDYDGTWETSLDPFHEGIEEFGPAEDPA